MSGPAPDTPDARIYAHWNSRGAANSPSLLETLAQRLHDHAVTDAMEEVLDPIVATLDSLPAHFDADLAPVLAQMLDGGTDVHVEPHFGRQRLLDRVDVAPARVVDATGGTPRGVAGRPIGGATFGPNVLIEIEAVAVVDS